MCKFCIIFYNVYRFSSLFLFMALLSNKNLVLIGTGWGGVSFLKSLQAQNLKSLTIISPRNYFLFTPLLPGVTTGTTEPRSIMDPVRSFIAQKRTKFPKTTFEFLEMEATAINPKTNMLTAFSEKANISKQIPYDLLVLAPGAQANDFGTPGVKENCFFLKEIPHARKIRNAIIDNFEKATLSDSEEEKKRLLSFVIVGGGPTGVEFAAEMNDFLVDDLRKAYPGVYKLASITVVQNAELILNMFDRSVSEFAEQNFKKLNIKLIKNAAVKEVRKEIVVVEERSTKTKIEMPYGICVWAAGIAPRKITANIIDTLGEPQKGSRLIRTDPFLKVKGADNIYAIGDCSMIECPDLVKRAEELFKKADLNMDGTLQPGEIEIIMGKLQEQYPLLDTESIKIFLKDKTSVDKTVWNDVLQALERSFRAAPATAQVAQQQGEYLAEWLTGETSQPWKKVDRGMMSYVGAAKAVMQTPITGAVTGSITFPLWRGAYASKLFSWRSRHLVVWDWAKKVLYGRDLSRM
jgi:NADH:ubiquinone reductase (non-electrogenic)